MKGIRVLVAVVALLALPLVAVHAQGRGNNCPALTAGNSGKVPPGQAKKCQPAAAAANSDANCPAQPAGNSGNVPPGQAKKCDSDPVPPPPPPPPSGPPTGINMVNGTVFADLDANGLYSPFAGDTVIAGASVQLLWNGTLYQSAATDANGFYQFNGLGSTDSPLWSVCVSVPAGVTQGPPPPGMSYNGCGGTGYSFAFSTTTTFAQGFVGNFGMLPL